MNVQLKPREIAHCVRDSGAALVLAWEEVAAVAAEGAELGGAVCESVAAESIAARRRRPSLATSLDASRRHGGDPLHVWTTGSPKGAELTHANLESNTSAVASFSVWTRPT